MRRWGQQASRTSIVERAQAVSVLKSLYYERAVPGASVALARAGTVRSDDVCRRQGDHDVCTGRNRCQARSMSEAHACA